MRKKFIDFEFFSGIWNGFGYVGMLMIEVVFHTVFVMYCMLNLSPKLAIIPCI